MYIFYTLEDIKNFIIFNQFDLTNLSSFENCVLVLLVNIFYLLFLYFCFSLIYKIVSRLYNAIF